MCALGLGLGPLGVSRRPRWPCGGRRRAPARIACALALQLLRALDRGGQLLLQGLALGLGLFGAALGALGLGQRACHPVGGSALAALLARLGHVGQRRGGLLGLAAGGVDPRRRSGGGVGHQHAGQALLGLERGPALKRRRDRLEHVLVVAAQAGELGPGGQVGGQVADEEAELRALAEPDRDEGELERELGAVAVAGLDGEARGRRVALAVGQEALPAAHGPVLVATQHRVEQRAADDPLGLPAEQQLRPVAPARDPAVGPGEDEVRLDQLEQDVLDRLVGISSRLAYSAPLASAGLPRCCLGGRPRPRLLDLVVDLEHRQVHRDHDEPDDRRPR